jgi:release factor glutamine methyltransferase
LACVTVLEGIQKGAEFLDKKGVESPRLQAELMLAHVLQVPRMQLYLNFERVLTSAETDRLRELIRRRGRREPWQHIVGSTSFCGLHNTVNRQVLIPRPETELLADLGWQFLSTVSSPPSTVLDFGTGSGCIAVAIAVNCPDAHIHATDVSAGALAVAKQNASIHQVQDRIQFLQSDGFSALPEGLRFDLIISNPPYIPSAEIASLQPEVRDHDPRGALDGGADGLDYFRRLAADAPGWLKPQARLMAEFGDGQGATIAALFEQRNWIVEAIREDYTQHPRFLIARFRQETPVADGLGAG